MSGQGKNPADNWLKQAMDANRAGQGEKAKISAREKAASASASPEDHPQFKPERSRAGKRSDKRYTQVKVYLKAETRLAVAEALLRDPEGRDLSELVQELIEGWVASR